MLKGCVEEILSGGEPIEFVLLAKHGTRYNNLVTVKREVVTKKDELRFFDVLRDPEDFLSRFLQRVTKEDIDIVLKASDGLTDKEQRDHNLKLYFEKMKVDDREFRDAIQLAYEITGFAPKSTSQDGPAVEIIPLANRSEIQLYFPEPIARQLSKDVERKKAIQKELCRHFDRVRFSFLY